MGADLSFGSNDGRTVSQVLTNYVKDGRTFSNFLRVFPLWSGGSVAGFMGVLEKIDPESPEKAGQKRTPSPSSGSASASSADGAEGMGD